MSPLHFGLVSWLLLFAGLVAGQSVHIVQVGWDGSFFSPSTVSALLNDTVRFVFAGNFHTVTQSSFFSPCTPLRGGFDSGAVKQSSDGQFPSWDLRITNVSSPIWYFCAIGTPSSHCNAGMVGVINPPSIQNYNDFVAAAKLVTGTPQPSPTVHLTGQGAIATNPPSLTGSISGSASSSSPTSSSTSTSSTTEPSPSTTTAELSSGGGKSKNKGGIIAGAVVGSFVLLAVLFFLFWYLRRKHDDATVKEFFQYRVPMRVPSSSGFSPNMMMSTTARRAIPPATTGSGSHYTTTPTPVVLPRPLRRSSFDNEAGGPESESNRGSVPTYSSDAKSSTDGFLANSRNNNMATHVPIPSLATHPYMAVTALPSPSERDAPPVAVQPVISGSQHGHAVGHNVNGSMSQLAASAHGHTHNGSTSQLGHGSSGGGGEQQKRQRAPAPEPPSRNSIENPAPPVYESEHQP